MSSVEEALLISESSQVENGGVIARALLADFFQRNSDGNARESQAVALGLDPSRAWRIPEIEEDSTSSSGHRMLIGSGGSAKPTMADAATGCWMVRC